MTTPQEKLKILVVFNYFKPLAAPDIDSISEAAVENEALAIRQALINVGHIAELYPINDLMSAIEYIKVFQPDVIFNLCEGFRNTSTHEMNVAGLWELMEIPYTGNTPLTLGLAQNKVLTKRILHTHGLLTPEYEVYDGVPEQCELEYPLIAKPSHEDGSLGITQDSIIHDFENLQKTVCNLLEKYDQPILVEKFIAGREFNIAVLGNDEPQVLPPSEISFKRIKKYYPITSYEAKWLNDHPLYKQTPPICPAKIPVGLNQRLSDLGLRVYHLLMGRDYGRIDVRMDENENLFVLEYNPNPDISPDAGYIRSLKAAGMDYEHFADFLVHEALTRKTHVHNT